MGLKLPPLVGTEAERGGQRERLGAAEALEGSGWLEGRWTRRRRLGFSDGSSGWTQQDMVDNRKVSMACQKGRTPGPGRTVGPAQGFPRNAHWG